MYAWYADVASAVQLWVPSSGLRKYSSTWKSTEGGDLGGKGRREMVKPSKTVSDMGAWRRWMWNKGCLSPVFVSLNSFKRFSKLSGGELRTARYDADLWNVQKNASLW